MSTSQTTTTTSERFWSLGAELYRAFHQWPLILLFVVAGSLAGAALAYLLPADHRSTQQVYVGLNPYRSMSDANFLALARPKYSNIDDYKNWQMTQLETVIFLDAIIDETLVKLQSLDPYWQSYTKEQLKDMLDADWRSAGVWSLAAINRQPLRAEQAARAWRETAVSVVNQAVLAAHDTFLIDQELQSNADAILAAKMRRELLDEARIGLSNWVNSASALPQNERLTRGESWHVNSLVTYPAAYTPAWTRLLDEQPPQTAPRQAYLEWIERVLFQIDEEIPRLALEVSRLEAKRPELQGKYTQAAEKSMSLSPNLTLEGFDELPAEAMRSSGLLILIGAICGLLFWLVLQLVLITRKQPRP